MGSSQLSMLTSFNTSSEPQKRGYQGASATRVTPSIAQLVSYRTATNINTCKFILAHPTPSLIGMRLENFTSERSGFFGNADDFQVQRRVAAFPTPFHPRAGTGSGPFM
ncbi:unnamed protein product [Strongylus vulgaris]|uniref:Uncharacterized protein n=1 Tax=Strongylus vulgaris TaxID=40348 RepID=A0A3P7IH71_STRVU|nr:unnamed protein product [Strongylus vulgaris]